MSTDANFKIFIKANKIVKISQNKFMRMRIFKIFSIFSLIFVSFCGFFNLKAEPMAICKSASKPMLSIVIDDFGSYDQSGVETLLKCKEPLTCAVIPFVDNSKANAEFARNNGHEVILHMPMQAHVNLPESWYGPVYIGNHDSASTIDEKISKCIEELGGIKGFNSHIGSGVSQNRDEMKAIYKYAKVHNLFFLDSRTIVSSKAEEACEEAGCVYLGRDVFLEADKNKSYEGVKRRLLEGAKIAQQKGRAVVIGHVGAEGGENTAKAILDTVADIKGMGVEIVPLSTLYKDLCNSGLKTNM